MTNQQQHTITGATQTLIARMTDPHDRVHSWNHCRKLFRQLPATGPCDPTLLDNATVHLAFYLASYGMYRGSTQLLQKTYTVLTPVVDALRQAPYARIGDASESVTAAFAENRVEMIWEHHQRLIADLKKAGIQQREMGILTTKILLGTWCSVPAFDTALKSAVKEAGIGSATLSQKNLRAVFAFVRQNAAFFQTQVNAFHEAGHRLPAVRVVDMLLWHLGGGDKTTDAQANEA